MRLLSNICRKGTDPESSKDPAQMYTIYATSIFPNLSSSELSDSALKTAVNTCFNSRFNSIPSSKQSEFGCGCASER